jgi:AbiU2
MGDTMSRIGIIGPARQFSSLHGLKKPHLHPIAAGRKIGRVSAAPVAVERGRARMSATAKSAVFRQAAAGLSGPPTATRRTGSTPRNARGKPASAEPCGAKARRDSREELARHMECVTSSACAASRRYRKCCRRVLSLVKEKHVATDDEGPEAAYLKIPAGVRDVYCRLESEVVWTFDRRHSFKTLFRKNAQRIELMNALSPQFFGEIQMIWADDVILHVCRLTDEPSERNRERLSLAQLHKKNALGPDVDREFKRTLKRLWKDAQRNSQPLRNYRNVRIAHLDKPTSLGATPLAGITAQQIEDSLSPIREYMRTFRLNFASSELYFGEIQRLDNADTFVHWLKRAYAYHELEKEEIPNGSWEYLRRIQEGRFKDA